MIRLWSINRWLRWTGFVLIVEVDASTAGEREPTRLGLVWIGLPPDRAWARHCERTRLARERAELAARRADLVNDLARGAFATVERAVDKAVAS